jgi:hypothetical protein
MQLICDGFRTKREVIDESLEQYKAVFVKARRDFHVLVEVRTKSNRPSLSHSSEDCSYRRMCDVICGNSRKSNQHDGRSEHPLVEALMHSLDRMTTTTTAATRTVAMLEVLRHGAQELRHAPEGQPLGERLPPAIELWDGGGRSLRQWTLRVRIRCSQGMCWSMA